MSRPHTWQRGSDGFDFCSCGVVARTEADRAATESTTPCPDDGLAGTQGGHEWRAFASFAYRCARCGREIGMGHRADEPRCPAETGAEPLPRFDPMADLREAARVNTEAMAQRFLNPGGHAWQRFAPDEDSWKCERCGRIAITVEVRDAMPPCRRNPDNWIQARAAQVAESVPKEVHERGWQWRPVGDGAFAPPFGTIRVCRGCGCLVAGGPTACSRCAEPPPVVGEVPALPVDDGPTRVVYVAHPLGSKTGEREANRARAARWVGWIAETFGVAPVADWIVLSTVWPEDDEHRARGLAIDVALVARCDELWMVGGRVSAGMQIEADAARRAGVRVVDLTALGEEAPVRARSP